VTLALAAAFGLAPMLFLPLPAALCIVPVLLIAWLVFRQYIRQRLGGYTGDVLGAFQQISELLFYLFFLASLKLS
jgi:adenosylcobinamide-GDP ribazoletransferase